MQILCSVLAFAGVLSIALPFVIQGFSPEGWRQVFANSALSLVLLSTGISGTLLIPTFRRRSTLFKAALASRLSNVPMVANQPVPDNSAIVSPITIRRRIRWRAALAWHTIFFLVATSAISSLFLGYEILTARLEGTTPEELPLMIWVISVIVLTCGLATGLGTIMLPLQLHTIHVTDEGITQVQTGSTSVIAWQDVRVFALVEGGRRPNSPVAYLLSSGKNSVRWTHRSRMRWYSITAPTTSDDEYQRQMDALLSYAAARTSLPLLDLR